ncbi:MAG: acyl-CoA dehydrogenase [Archangium sp.]|nr:acyl-CoA dehydrogenase [Archangium sp.]
MSNPLISDALIELVLHEVLDVEALFSLPAFSEHSTATLTPWLEANRRLARDVLYPTWRPMDAEPPRFEGGRVITHVAMPALWKRLVELGVISATRPVEVGGQQLPLTVSTLSSLYLMAGNLAATGFAGLTTGAAHLIEAFGGDAVKSMFLEKMYSGQWTGTMALTEPHAGSSLADLRSTATPTAHGHYLLRGAKIFISGGDQSFTENIVHLVLARIDGAPAGTKGISLFAVPRLRVSPAGLVPNDVHVSGAIHKIGWRGLPSVALAFGDEHDCHGFLVGEPHQGLRCMFQMMNEARIMVGASAVATASAAFHESLAWATERRQGRPLGVTDPSTPQVALIEHPDVRRMLLRQKAIVEGSLCLIGVAARYADLSAHGADEETRATSKLMLDLLTPMAKTFPSEKGFESTALALQIHGGYGYSSEYPPELWLREQKLNTIHEGTTSIQGLDLLARKMVAGGGAALMALQSEVLADVERAKSHGIDTAAVERGLERLVALTATLGARGLEGDFEGMVGHSADYLELASTLVIGWMWLKLTLAVHGRDDDFAKGIRAAAQYWFVTELPRIDALAALCESAERSYLDVTAAQL